MKIRKHTPLIRLFFSIGMKIKITTRILCSLLLTQVVMLPDFLYSQSDFYRGKSITLMPGAAGRKAVNHIYSTAKPDGLAIGAVGAGLVAGPILGLPGSQYDIDKLIYLGSTESGDPYVFVSRKEAGFDSLDKLRAATGLRIGAQAVGHPVFISGRMSCCCICLRSTRIACSRSS